MKFGQLVEYNIRNIFLEQSYTKCGEKTIRRPFLKNQNWEYLWNNSLKFYTICFCRVASSWLSEYIEVKPADHFI